jgi:hypothetical protein
MSDGVPLSGAPLLGTMAERVQEELLAAAEPTALPAQEWLFHRSLSRLASRRTPKKVCSRTDLRSLV